MQGFEKYYRKSWPERLAVLEKEAKLTSAQVELLKQNANASELGETMIENFITQYQLPEGLALNLVVNDKEYLVPMATEEPSVIAAASHGAGIVKRCGGFKAKIHGRLMLGQVVCEQVVDAKDLCAYIQANEQALLACANQAHPSIVKRGGGARWVRSRILAPDLVSLDLAVDVQEAMGANMLNTMLEALASHLEENYQQAVLMSILSNYATECLVTATCELPVTCLAKNGIDGATVAAKLSQASRLAQLDPYRATTHNKGIMNGIDAAVLASGNDWRAIEAGAHAYAARDGQYRGLSQWHVQGKILKGELTLPLPLGSVGGSIGIVPLVKVNHTLLNFNGAKELETIIASLGLAQNLAALYALVTEGIQKGHMSLQLKSLAVAVGAKGNEIFQVVQALKKQGLRDSKSASEILKQLRAKA